MRTWLTIALPKGRLQQDAGRLFEAAFGVNPAARLSRGRRLSWSCAPLRLKFLSVRAADVPAYVEGGAADLGIAGRDVLREGRHDLYEPLDLGIGRCRLVLAAPAEGSSRQARPITAHLMPDRPGRPLRIATKYPRIAAEFFSSRGVPIELTPLHGAVELAPALGLADAIVDITETGETLRANGLTVVETILPVSARLAVSRVSLKRAPGRVRELVNGLSGVARS